MEAPSVSVFELARTVPLLEVIRYYTGIELKRRSRAYVSRCPFHEDMNPSFTRVPGQSLEVFRAR